MDPTALVPFVANTGITVYNYPGFDYLDYIETDTATRCKQAKQTYPTYPMYVIAALRVLPE